MPRFIAEDDFWSLFLQAKIGVVICQGIDNSIKNVEVYEKLLQEAGKEAQQFLKLEELSSNPVILVWREAQRTMLTEKTKNAFLCMELVDETRSDEFHRALKELSDLVSRHLGGTVKLEVLDIHNREMAI